MKYSTLLQQASLKNTKPRQLILDCLCSSKKAQTAEEILLFVQKTLPINLSTVYRTLRLFAEKGLADKIIGSDSVALYQIKTAKHSHYITCTKCHRQRLIASCPLEELSHELGESTGYIITGHQLTFTGICPHCAKNK